MVAPRRAHHRTAEEAGLIPLPALVAKCNPEAVTLIQEKFKLLEISKLVSLFTTALVKADRVPAFLLALELGQRGIAPAFRRPEASSFETKVLEINREYDLIVYDIAWLCVQYSTHKPAWPTTMPSKPDSWKHLFAFTDRLFWLGNRPFWFMVKKLKLSERQQWECRLLQSLPVKRRTNGLNQCAQHIYDRLEEKLPSIMRTMSKGEDREARAHEILRKRKRLWICAEMSEWRPTETARLYKCMTGETLTKSHTANQLDAIYEYKRKPQRKRTCPEDAE